MSSKGPPPRVDLSKKGIEDLNDFLLGEKSISQLIEENDDKEEADSESSDLGKSAVKKKKNSSFLATASSPKANSKSPSTTLIGKLKDAQTLLLSNNKIKYVPLDFPVRFEELRALYLDHNNISEFPGALCQLPHLEKLHLEFNLIKEIPGEIKMLKSSIKKLYLFNNELVSLPEEIGELTLLSTLDIHNNNIGILPYQLALNSQLTELSIYNNPILSPPPFICNKGIVHIVKYMREIRESYIQTVPEEQYIWSRKINITEAKSKLKRTPSTKVLTRTSSSFNESTKSTKAISAEIKKKGGSAIFRDVVEDNVFISQSHLLYYLTDYHCHETCGRREYMEDRCIALPRLKQHKPNGLLNEVINMFSKVGYFGVYDGHGGDKCADYLIENMHKNIVNCSAFAKGDFETAIKNGFKVTDEAFLKKCKEHGLIDGSTALVALLIDDKLITAHAGDSRAVLCRDKKAVRLTEDHKPDRVDELARVEDIGGEVIYRGNCFRVMGDLAMSRSFGDLRLKDPKPYVICDPEIRIEELTPKDEFIILASDGLWDVFTDQRAVDLVRKCANVEEASKKLVETALALGTMDNTTVIVVKLDWCLDFVTQNELDGKPENTKRPTSKELSATVSTATASPSSSNNNHNPNNNNNSTSNTNTTSFRNSLETPEFSVKSIYPQVSSTQTAIKLKVLIPHIEATKLMKFDVSTTIKEIERVIQRKHRFEETLEIEIYKKETSTGDILLNKDNTLLDYKFQDMDQIELRKLGTAPAAPHEDAPSTAVQDEVLSQISENDNPDPTHRTTMLWEGPLVNTTENNKEPHPAVDINNNNNNIDPSSEWRRVRPDSASNRRDTYRVPPPGSPRLDSVKAPFQETELVTHEHNIKQTEPESSPDNTTTQPEEQNAEPITEKEETKEKEL